MGLEMELQFRKVRGEGFSPNTVLPSPRHCSDLEKQNVKVKGKDKPACEDNRLSLKEDFREISFGCYRSSSCKNIPSRPVFGFEGNVELKRGSIYQSSREVSKMKKRGSIEGRKKIQVPRGSDGGLLSFSVVDSLCSSDEESQRERSSVMSQNVEQFSDDFFEICLDSNNRETCSSENEGNELEEKAASLHKSLSANVETSKLPSSSEKRLKTRFSPIRKIFDPFVNNKRNKTLRKSLLDDFSKAPGLEANEPHNATRDRQHSLVTDSPVHLHGCLKLENKDGMPYFEFSLKCPEEVLVAKTWKSDNASNWVYTFHSIDNSKRSNASSWNDSSKESPMVGQMQVSCYLCSDSSMVTEFVLYDIAHARKSVVTPNSSKTEKGSDKGLLTRFSLGNEPDLAKVNPQPKQVLDNKALDSSCSCPWAASELHTNLEVAATVIQIPFEKRENLNLLKLSKMDPKGRVTDSSSSAKVNVVIPSGNHGMPSDESRCPSALLDRWRVGGGCDCGGWDMACPLLVFGNPGLQSGEDRLLTKNHQPLELFVQGSKENVPALTLTFMEEGGYAVDFHAQLSTLQAFSICVAILHSAEASQCSSLKTLIEEKVKFLIEAVTEEEKRKVTTTRKETSSSFVLNPPFSPIARVTSSSVDHMHCFSDASGRIQESALDAATKGNSYINSCIRLNEEMKGIDRLARQLKVLRRNVDALDYAANKLLWLP